MVAQVASHSLRHFRDRRSRHIDRLVMAVPKILPLDLGIEPTWRHGSVSLWSTSSPGRRRGPATCSHGIGYVGAFWTAMVAMFASSQRFAITYLTTGCTAGSPILPGVSVPSKRHSPRVDDREASPPRSRLPPLPTVSSPSTEHPVWLADHEVWRGRTDLALAFGPEAVAGFALFCTCRGGIQMRTPWLPLLCTAGLGHERHRGIYGEAYFTRLLLILD